MFFELGNLGRPGDLDLAVMESFSPQRDHLLVGWKPDSFVGGGGRGVFTTFLSCLVPKNETDRLVGAVNTHPHYPYKIAEALYPHGFVPTAKPDEIRNLLNQQNIGMKEGDLDAAVMRITDLTRMKRKAPQTQLWFADLRNVTNWTHDTIKPMGQILKLT